MQEGETVENKRKNLRVPILVTQVKGEHKGKVFFGYAKNISRVGIFIQTVSPKEEGERFRIEFTLPETETIIACQAEVVWARDFKPNTLYEPGMGLKFVDLPEIMSEEVNRWVKAHMKVET